MASTKEDVSRHNVPHVYVQKTVDENGSPTLTLAFTDIRGRTTIGGEGDHTSANAAYLDFAVLTSQRHIGEAKGKSFATGVTSLEGDIKARALQDDYFLRKFGLTSRNYPDEKPFEAVFAGCTNEIDILYEEYEAKVLRVYEDLAAKEGVKTKSINLKNLLATVAGNQQVEGLTENIEALTTQAEMLDEKLSQEMITDLKKEYFFKVAEMITNTYLSSQSWQAFVTFEKHTKIPAKGSEGSDVRRALEYLRQFSNPNEPVKNVADVVAKISALLHYPPLPNNIIKDYGTPNKRDRTNDIRILQFVLARHLSLMFAAYPALKKDETIKEKIIEDFLNEKLETWVYNDGKKTDVKYNLTAGEKDDIKKAIKSALKEADDLVAKSKSAASRRSLTNLERPKEQLRSDAMSEYKTKIPSEREISTDFKHATAHENESIPPLIPSGMSYEAFNGLEEEAKQPDSSMSVGSFQRKTSATSGADIDPRSSNDLLSPPPPLRQGGTKGNTLIQSPASTLSGRVSNLSNSWSRDAEKMQQRSAVAGARAGVSALVQKDIDAAKKRQEQAKLAAIKRGQNKQPFGGGSKAVTKPIPGGKTKKT